MRNHIHILTMLLAGAANLFSQSLDRSSVWMDTVKRGEMVRQVRGLGEITGPRTVVLQVAETQVREIHKGLSVVIDTRGPQNLAGVVDSVGGSAANGAVPVTVALSRPAEPAVGTQVDGTINIE